ncbi:MAG: threonine synthase, partial [Fluviibacter sp.]
LVLETAQPAKFAETIEQAIGQLPQPPKGLEHLEDLPQRVEVIDPDVNVVKAFIQQHVTV